jgi:leucyl-tRNA---protein transferase
MLLKVGTEANLYLTEQGTCSYLSGLSSRHLIVEPDKLITYSMFDALIQRGYRRSGTNLYRPWCDSCRSCLSVRVNVNQFKTKRSQRRTWKKNQHIRLKRLPPILYEEHFNLYHKYLLARHPGDNMGQMNEADYMDFLTCQWARSSFFCFYDKDRLMGVSAVDQIDNGLSATYTFFDPEYADHSPGVFSILSLIEACKSLKLNYLYLGFYIPDCDKMNYKKEYQPLEYFYDDLGWVGQN